MALPIRVVSVLLLLAVTSHAEQFVLFDVTFTYAKNDADTSTPSKSHYYVRDASLNQDRPKDWTSPVDYRNGTVHIRTEVLEKPAGGENTEWTLCYIPNKGQGNGIRLYGKRNLSREGRLRAGCANDFVVASQSIVWTEGIKQMDMVIKDGSGGQGHAHRRPDAEKFFPTRVRITMVQVSAGSTYDPQVGGESCISCKGWLCPVMSM